MRCPSCRQSVESTSEACRCGFHVEKLDNVFGSDPVQMNQIHDPQDRLRLREVKSLTRKIIDFEQQFPQFFAAYYVGKLPDRCLAPEFGTWLLNRGRMVVDGEMRNNENCFLFILELERRYLTLVMGYYAEKVLDQIDLDTLIQKAAKPLREQQLGEGLERCLLELGKQLRRKHRLLRRG